MSSRHRIPNGTTLAQLQDEYGLSERAAAYCAEEGLITLGRIRKATRVGPALCDEAIVKDLQALLAHLRSAPEPIAAAESVPAYCGPDLNHPIYRPLRMPMSVRVLLLNEPGADIRLAYSYLSPITREVLDGRLEAYNSGKAWAALANDVPLEALTTANGVGSETLREIHYWWEEMMALKEVRERWG